MLDPLSLPIRIPAKFRLGHAGIGSAHRSCVNAIWGMIS
jgi:hypothetical protein